MYVSGRCTAQTELSKKLKFTNYILLYSQQLALTRRLRSEFSLYDHLVIALSVKIENFNVCTKCAHQCTVLETVKVKYVRNREGKFIIKTAPN